MLRMLVIADDLAGAADCAVACVRPGLSTVVALDGIPGDVDADVISVDADTRHREPRAASAAVRRLVRRLVRRAPGAGSAALFKKIDSTLRGNVGEELAAALEARRGLETGGTRIAAVLAPAFPAHGRTTVNGQQLVDGRALSETEFGRRSAGGGDDGQLRSSRSLMEMMNAAGLQATLVDLEQVRSASDNLRRVFATGASATDVLVCDAETEQDLDAIAKAGAALGRGTVWAGSAGLAYHLPGALGLVGASGDIRPEGATGTLVSGPTLFAMGSLSNATLRQTEELARSGEVEPLTVAPGDLLAQGRTARLDRQVFQLQQAFAAGRDALVVIGADARPGATPGRRLSAALASLVAPLAGKAGALVASGGETARAILQAWDITALRMVCEVEPGLPYALAENWHRRLPVLTKAGGFGQPRTLLHCQRFLRELERGPLTSAGKGQAVR